LEYRFEPQGLTFMLLLSASHLLVHTWPEYDVIIVDVFVCTNDFDIDSFIQELVRITGASQNKLETVVFEHTKGD
jgi:S-adenosylmethionine decarboxylase